MGLRTGRELHWYYSTDRHSGKTISDPAIRDHLHSLDSGITNGRIGRLPLVIGMPVIISSNFDVGYWVDNDGRRHATSCVVEAEQIEGAALPYLEARQGASIEDTKDITFTHPFTGVKLLVKRTQVPIQPGFAMTTHKAQGLTLEKAVLDLESCTGTEAPYVMLSRVRTLEGVVVLRPFDRKRISCRLSQDARIEFRRQELLCLVTKAVHGNPAHSALAKTELLRMGLSHVSTDSPGGPSDDQDKFEYLVRQNHEKATRCR